MTFDNTQPHQSDSLSLTELDLYHLIMDYRAANGLAAIPLSLGLTTTAGRHTADTLYNIWEPGLVLPPGANLHSWSDAPYYSDHSQAPVMWEAPQRIGTSYPSNGFEISAAGYGDIASALNGWKGSPGHNDVILNQGIWASSNWNAIGIGVDMDSSVSTYGGRVYHVWFGRVADPDGAAQIAGTSAADTITGTVFGDTILGLAGDDTLNAGKGNDTIDGGDGADTINASGGKDVVTGGDGADTVALGGGNDRFFDNSQAGANGRDTVIGGGGRDIILGGGGHDVFQGGRGDDRILGGAGNDRLTGGTGNDVLAGQSGRNVLNGGAGDDQLTGGAARDVFIFSNADFGQDTVRGYDADIVRIKAAGEASSQVDLIAALSDVDGNTVYDHLSDGVNVITLEGVAVAALDLSLFDLG